MFIKYGAEPHLKALKEQGNIYFNPCKFFRDLEAQQLLKGIGDRNDGGIVTGNGRVLLQDKMGKYYESPNQSIAFIVAPCLYTPVFCIKQASSPIISIHERELIREQFPDHTHALVIPEEKDFLDSVQNSFDQKAFSHRIFYQDKFYTDFLEFLGRGKSDTKFIEPEASSNYYADFFMIPENRDIPPTHCRINDSIFYKTMFRKNTFFSNQVEYRVVLPYEKIGAGKQYSISPFNSTLCLIDDLVM